MVSDLFNVCFCSFVRFRMRGFGFKAFMMIMLLLIVVGLFGSRLSCVVIDIRGKSMFL